MKQSAHNLRCEDFQAYLPDLIGSGERITDHPHLQTCELCRALLADLDAIAQAARRLFPVEEPPDALWKHIESAIVKGEATTEIR
jgi:predicted anti-sigma-YlaC factor YlaD